MTPPPDAVDRILVAEDDDDLGRLVEWTLLDEGFDVHWAKDGDEATEAAFRLRPDLALLDVMMPGRDGLSVCEALRHDPRTASMPIILLTAKATTNDKVAGLQLGADDYVTKPFDPFELVARIRACLRRARALRDVSPLTGLPGNREITGRLDLLISTDRPFALIHADLDRFKQFNDHEGFARGDDVIVATAELLQAVVDDVGGQDAFLGHVGGDDFAIVVDPDRADAVASEVVSRFDALAPSYELVGANTCRPEHERRGADRADLPRMTISMGIATTKVRQLRSPVMAAAIATEMKEVAKRLPGSSFAIDRRSA